MATIETATLVQAQRLNQLVRLNQHFDAAQRHADGPITVRTSDSSFVFQLDNSQRFTFYRMLKGRLESMEMEGMGKVAAELVGGRMEVR